MTRFNKHNYTNYNAEELKNITTHLYNTLDFKVKIKILMLNIYFLFTG